ncbi:MAG: 4-(cytidine 5'-diphospho)-2-C-methyl-D-erythritol kinase [Clostridia bacterium]|nr:4-(cytidine 5'-diphospho)-2-C-methyl-D-erythritol kinase [Clostridia bacterium]
MRLTAKAYAKINLSLDITSVLPNGYHALNTVMQSVSLYDTVTVDTDAENLALTCDRADVPSGDGNTAFKAAAMFFEAAGLKKAAKIHIEKTIPSQAGLGGGSADAAAALRLLNAIHGNPLTDEKLIAIGAKVGADVPFCLKGGTCLCQNIGEVLSPLPHTEAYVVIAKPQAGVATMDAFRRFDAGQPLRRPDNDALLFHLANGDPRAAAQFAANVFSELVPLPEYVGLRAKLDGCGAFWSGVSGSGSAVFGLFDKKEDAEAAAAAAEKKVPFVYLGKTMPTGIEIL